MEPQITMDVPTHAEAETEPARAKPIEKETDTWHIRGYPKLARLLGLYPEAAVFRRFSALGMLNLLSLQAELISIENELRDLWEEDDSSSDSEVRLYTSDFYRLHRSTEPNDDQLLLLKSSREKLEQYCSSQ